MLQRAVDTGGAGSLSCFFATLARKKPFTCGLNGFFTPERWLNQDMDKLSDTCLLATIVVFFATAACTESALEVPV
ncbi:hypothetical protein [Vogesella sp. LIG4]|uniref:hypothetical protein n=1 Tax=Vogesella sp. LIG4 TaxID=1192162 RepID=UPI0012FD851D|nr:hypothetical protein [Vogesella sp. LIG4]